MRKSKIYFAHPVNTYNTILEKWYYNKLFLPFLDEIEIINPNTLKHQEAYKINGMDYFKDLVLSCDKVYILPFDDNSIGAGIYKEIEWALEANIPCIITKLNFDFEKVYRLNTLDQQVKILSVDETRYKLKQ